MSRPGCFSCFTQHLGSNHVGHDISNERYFGLCVGTSISRGAKSSQSISKVYCPTTEQLPETSKRFQSLAPWHIKWKIFLVPVLVSAASEPKHQLNNYRRGYRARYMLINVQQMWALGQVGISASFSVTSLPLLHSCSLAISYQVVLKVSLSIEARLTQQPSCISPNYMTYSSKWIK